MKAKQLFLTCLLAIVGSMAVHNANAAENIEIDGIRYRISYVTGNVEGIAWVMNNSYSGDVVIPESFAYNGKTYRVAYIWNEAFYECSGLTSVTIPNSVTYIGVRAFCNCSGLTSVTIPNSVTSIDKGAFAGCSGLSSVTIPNSVTSIGSGVFESCTSLTSITIPNSVTTISNYLFYECTSLTSLTIPNSVTSIGENAFWGSGLISLTIPNSVTSIGYCAFHSCSGLTSITIPNSVTSIGESAFMYCTSLTSVTIGSGVTSIGDEAFRGCTSLTSINVESGNSIYDSRDNCNAIIETSTNTIIYGCKKTLIPNSVTTIGNYAFLECSGLTSITIPNSVTSIGDHAFDGCSSLTSVTIPNSVTNIGFGAFIGCSGLTSITIPNSVTSIEMATFDSCSGLTSVTIPSSVTYIGFYSFVYCSSLSDVYLYAENVPNTHGEAFYSAFIGSATLGSATLHVPAASLEAYRAAAPWSSFGNIVAIESSAPHGFSNYKLYTLTSKRGGLVLNDDATGLAAGQIRTGATEAEKRFAIITINDGQYLYSPVNKQFLLYDGSFVSRTDTPITFDDNHADDDYKFMISMQNENGEILYLNNSDNSGIVIDDYDTPDDGNRWLIEPVDDFDPTEAIALVTSQTFTVTYNVMFDGKVVATATEEAAYGSALPPVPASLSNDFITLTETGTHPTTVKKDITVTYNATWEGPFEFTKTVGNAKWYNMHIRSGYYVGKQATEPYYPAQVDEATLATPAYQWAFGGDPYHVKVYNRSTGLNETLTKDGDNAVMRSGDYTWDLLPNSDGFVLRVTGTENSCVYQLGDYNGPLQIWTNSESPTDDGSTFRVGNVIDNGFSNSQLYTLTCRRGGMVLNSDATGLAAGQIRTDAPEADKRFAIISYNGAQYLYSPVNKQYLLYDGSFVSRLGSPITFDDSHADGIFEFMISTQNEKGETLYFNNDNGFTDSGFVIADYDTPDDGNRWLIEPVADFDPTEALALAAAQTYIVTYNVTFDGNVVATATEEVAYGRALPAIPASLSNKFITLTETGTHPTTVTEDLTVTYNATWNGPFEFTKTEENAKWYNMNIRNGYYVGKQATEPYYPSQVDEATLATPAYQWAFGGDPYHVKVYNRTTGLNETLTKDGDNAVMRSGDYTWDLLPNSNGFVLRVTGTENSCINQIGGNTGPLQIWTNSGSPTDDGSTFRVGDVIEETGPHGFSNKKLYTLTCKRGGMVLNANATGLAAGQIRTDETEADKRFAIITYEGAQYLYSPVNKQYLLYDGSFVSHLGSPITFDDTHADGNYKFMISTQNENGETLYFNNNGTYSVTGIIIARWDTPDDGNRWLIEPVADFNPTEALALASSQTFTVTYNVTFDGNVVATATEEVAYGSALPPAPASLSNKFITLTETGTHPTTVTEDVTVTYNATWKGPFEFTNTEESAKWYNLKIRGVWYVSKQDTEPYKPEYSIDEDKRAMPAYQWAFGGDPYHVKIYNRTTGLNETLTKDGENAVMRSGDYTWDLLPNNDGFVLRVTGTEYSCINQYGGGNGPLKFWTDSNSLTDDGSTFRVEEAIIISYAQTLSLTELPAMTYGDESYMLPATTDQEQTLTWTSSNTDVAIIRDNVLTIKGAGTTTVTASHAGNILYQPFSKEYTLNVAKAPLTISVGNYTKKQYDPMPEFVVSYEGFKNNETKDVLTKQPTVSCEANEDSAPGVYDVVVSGAEAENYEIKYVAGKLTVTEPDSYTLTYIVDGEVYQSFTIKYRESIVPLEAPTKEGYTFSGWSEIPATMPAHDVEVTGSFSVNSYTLTYKVDGEVYKTTTVVYGTALTPEAEPTKEGYTFSGWSEIPETMPAHDVEVTGTFSVNSYTLTYMVDGEVYKTASVEYGTALTPEAEPTKEGYTFSGWSEIPATMPAHDVEVTGSFSVNSYILTYKVDGEVYKTTTVVYGTALTPEAEPTKEGYTFSGWSEIPETMPAHDVTVTGTFSINSYTLTYKVDGEVYKTSSVVFGTALTPEAEPTKEGYTFSGWSEIPATMPAHDVEVTGTFSVNSYTLTYKVDGEVYKTSTVAYGTAVTPEAAPTKEGYTFSGWSEIPATMPAHDVEVTGTFTVNKYTVTFMYGDEVLTTIEVEYGAEIPLPESLDSDRYILIEWLDVPETMPAHDVVIYADFVDGISRIAEDSECQIYDQQGKCLSRLVRGINIIRYSDGTTKKVLIK